MPKLKGRFIGLSLPHHPFPLKTSPSTCISILSLLAIPNSPIPYILTSSQSGYRDLTHLRRRRRGQRLVKMCFYHSESPIYLELSNLSVGIKTCPCWICCERVQFQIGIRKLAVVVHVLQTTQNLVISRCCFAEDAKEMYQEL